MQSAAEGELEDLRIHGSLHFISLKKLNRIAHFRSKKVRDATNDVSNKKPVQLNLIIVSLVTSLRNQSINLLHCIVAV